MAQNQMERRFDKTITSCYTSIPCNSCLACEAAFGDEVVAKPAHEVFLKHRIAWVHDDCVAERSLASSTAATVVRMNFIIRRAQLADAFALPAIERSAAELFRCAPSLAWLADAQVTDAEQHQRAIETEQVWVAQSPDGVLMGFLSAVEVGNELHIQDCPSANTFRAGGRDESCC